MASALKVAQAFKPDVLITPNIIYGPFVSMAEALQKPVVTLDFQVNHPTSDFPLFTMEMGKFPKGLNRFFYWLKARLYPKTIKPKFDMMRELCRLPSDRYTDGTRFQIWPHDLPQLCAASPSPFSQPKDWPSQKLMGGWLIEPNEENYTPPPGLAEFLEHRPVYVGFGSMKGSPDFCRTLSTLAIKSLNLAGAKGVLLGGWAGLTRNSLDTTTDEGKRLFQWAEENVFEIDAAPMTGYFRNAQPWCITEARGHSQQAYVLAARQSCVRCRGISRFTVRWFRRRGLGCTWA